MLERKIPQKTVQKPISPPLKFLSFVVSGIAVFLLASLLIRQVGLAFNVGWVIGVKSGIAVFIPALIAACLKVCTAFLNGRAKLPEINHFILFMLMTIVIFGMASFKYPLTPYAELCNATVLTFLGLTFDAQAPRRFFASCYGVICGSLIYIVFLRA